MPPHPSMHRQLLHTLALASILSVTAQAQVPSDIGPGIYQKVSESVFLVETLDAAGNVLATGTAFVVGDQKLITNAHVVAEGRPVIRVAGLRIDCVVEKWDVANDLALLRTSASSGWLSLRLSNSTVMPGATLFAIGNPKGFERSISQGLFSGTREIDGRQLLQITTPISPGSSGSPIVNANGEVVGIAVSMISGGQNLNFAVPAAALSKFLSSDAPPASAEDILASINALNAQQDQTGVSDQAWGELEKQIDILLDQALRAASASKSVPLLIRVAEIAHIHNDDLAIAAARSADQLSKGTSVEAKVATAEALHWKAILADDSAEKTRLHKEAESLAAIAVKVKPSTEYLMLLARILQAQPERLDQAYLTYQRAVETGRKAGDTQIPLYQLFDVARRLKKPVEAKTWFKQWVDSGDATAYGWREMGRYLDELTEYGEAGAAYEHAAVLSFGTYNDLCEAAGSHFAATNHDAALRTARLCIEKGTIVENSEGTIGYGNRIISAVLNDRGVYEQAISHARQAIALIPKDPWAHYNLALGLNNLQRYTEAEAAAKTAIALSDGRYGEMHFQLGSAYFEQDNWPAAWQAYETAAEMLKSDWASAFNVAVSYDNAKFFSNALKWYEEALRRNPPQADGDHITRNMQELRSR